MAGNLHLIAANGTDNLSEPFDTHQHALDTLLEAMDTDNDAARLLRGAGLLSLHQRAGYIPSKDSRAIENVLSPDMAHEQIAYSAEALHFLNLIYWGHYTETYPEWLHWVALEEVAFPYEALPMMLWLASWFPSTQGLTKRVLGSRGRWLVEQSGHRSWHWAKHIKPARRPRLSKYEKYEARISLELEKLNYRGFTFDIGYQLRQMTFPWSQRFSKAISRTISTMFSMRHRLQEDDLVRIADMIKCYVHPDERETIILAFRNYNQLEETQAITRELEDLLQFRADMTAVFSS